MIQSYQETPVLLASNSSPLTFSTDCIRTRCANCYGFLQHSQGSPLYKILNGGNYDVTFNANVTSATAGQVALGLYMDGVLLPGTTVIADIATAGDYVNVAFTKTVPICCRGEATLTVQSVPSVLTGTTTTGTPTATQIPLYQNANFRISKRS